MRPFYKTSSRHHKARWLPLLLALALSGCGLFSKSNPSPAFPINAPPVTPTADAARAPEEFTLRGIADDWVNPDINDQPLSVVVRVYQLRSREEFSRLTFEALTSGRSDAMLFPKDLLNVNELVLVPSSTQAINDKLLPETKFVGVVGFFRRPDPQYWRLLLDARAVRNEGLIFRAKHCYLTAITPRTEPVPGQIAGGKMNCYGFASPPPGTRSR